MLDAKRIATNDKGIDFWNINGHVYRASTNSPKDIWGLPQDKRWECTIAHWERYRDVFSWARDITTIKVVCSYCNKEMGEKDGEGVTGVSHSICEKCQIIQRAELLNELHNSNIR